MEYIVNPSVWASIFAVPTVVTDMHIKMASGQQLKVLLFVLRHNNEEYDISFLSKGVGMKEEDVKDAMQYWIENGIIQNKTDEVKPVELMPSVKTEEKHVELPDLIPTYDQVVARTSESPELKCLFNEAQLKLGKTLGYDTQAKLLMIYDHYGLPIEVILTIIQYAASKGKPSMAYITKISKDWADKEIDNLEKAENKLKAIEKSEKVWKKFVSMISVDPPQYTDKRSELLDKWFFTQKQSLNLIYTAYEEMIEKTNKINFSYMDKILTNWYEGNVKNPDDVEVKKQERKTLRDSKAPSYDSKQYQDKARQVATYKRRQF